MNNHQYAGIIKKRPCEQLLITLLAVCMYVSPQALQLGQQIFNYLSRALVKGRPCNWPTANTTIAWPTHITLPRRSDCREKRLILTSAHFNRSHGGKHVRCAKHRWNTPYVYNLKTVTVNKTNNEGLKYLLLRSEISIIKTTEVFQTKCTLSFK